jgi:hypothetical protein
VSRGAGRPLVGGAVLYVGRVVGARPAWDTRFGIPAASDAYSGAARKPLGEENRRPGGMMARIARATAAFTMFLALWASAPAARADRAGSLAPDGLSPTWTVQGMPAPPVRTGQLAGIACPSSHVCFAVGSFRRSLGVRVPLVGRWDGAGWVVQARPRGAEGRLSGVSCWSASGCLAVGRTVDRTGPEGQLVRPHRRDVRLPPQTHAAP